MANTFHPGKTLESVNNTTFERLKDLKKFGSNFLTSQNDSDEDFSMCFNFQVFLSVTSGFI
jgi:hypothetical protein